METPSQSFRRRVLPPWQSYIGDVDEEWKARAVAHAVSSHLEWVYQYYERSGDLGRVFGAKDIAAFREALCLQVPEIAVVRDLADADKHRFLTRGQRRVITTATASFDEVSSRLYFKDGRNVLDVLKSVVNFWRSWRD